MNAVFTIMSKVPVDTAEVIGDLLMALVMLLAKEMLPM